MRSENAQPHFVRVGPQGGISQPRLPNPVTCGTRFARDTKALEDHTSSPTPRLLRGGCYLIRFTPVQPDSSSGALRYIGTLRVERNATDTLASGDLYLHARGTVTKEPNPADGIPVLPRHRYRYRLPGRNGGKRSRSLYQSNYDLQLPDGKTGGKGSDNRRAHLWCLLPSVHPRCGRC